jgi:hypothetical protein
MSRSVFLSWRHGQGDEAQVRALAGALRRAGLEVWFDLDGGVTDWGPWCQERARLADVVVVVMTPGYEEACTNPGSASTGVLPEYQVVLSRLQERQAVELVALHTPAVWPSPLRFPGNRTEVDASALLRAQAEAQAGLLPCLAPLLLRIWGLDAARPVSDFDRPRVLTLGLRELLELFAHATLMAHGTRRGVALRDAADLAARAAEDGPASVVRSLAASLDGLVGVELGARLLALLQEARSGGGGGAGPDPAAELADLLLWFDRESAWNHTTARLGQEKDNALVVVLGDSLQEHGVLTQRLKAEVVRRFRGACTVVEVSSQAMAITSAEDLRLALSIGLQGVMSAPSGKVAPREALARLAERQPVLVILGGLRWKPEEEELSALIEVLEQLDELTPVRRQGYAVWWYAPLAHASGDPAGARLADAVLELGQRMGDQQDAYAEGRRADPPAFDPDKVGWVAIDYPDFREALHHLTRLRLRLPPGEERNALERWYQERVAQRPTLGQLVRELYTKVAPFRRSTP